MNTKPQKWRVTEEGGESREVLVNLCASGAAYNAQYDLEYASGSSPRNAVLQLALKCGWPAVEILAPRAPSTYATPLPAPTCDGVWILVRKGKPGEPVEITGLRKVKGITRYHVDHFGTECGNSELGYEDCEWIKYVSPIVRRA